MNEKLVEFAGLMRENGVPVSTAETIDAIGAIEAVGLSNHEAFRAALRSTMVKRSRDLPLFERLFEIYFSGLGEILKRADQEVRQSLTMNDAEFRDFLRKIKEFLQREGQELSALARRLLENNAGELERLIRQAARAVALGRIERPLEESHFMRALARALQLDQASEELRSFNVRVHQRFEAAAQDPVDRYIELRLKAIDDIVRRFVRLERDKHDIRAREEVRLGQLGEKSFYYLSPEELEKMNDAVTRLARRLKGAIAMRRKTQKRGRFDIKRTLRRNLECGGAPFRLQFDRRRKDKPRIVILCDISDSVRNASRFMLQFVYSLQDLYAKVRSFVFVSEIGEVTAHFNDNEMREALDAALGGDIIDVYAHSNFGNAFRVFARDHIDVVDKRTTVIVLGDARNNYNLPHEWSLREIRQRARRLIWLNPESRNTWGFGDSEMERYAAHCDLVEECRNLNQLYRAIDRLTPR